ncbi:MAG: ArsC family reductase [Methylococcaceae bacterium]
MTMLTLYGIPNCDSCKKARIWLNERGMEYRFHDIKKNGLEAEWLNTLIERLGYERLLNRRGSTWRQLSASQQADWTPAKALALMLEYPSLIKRPVLVRGDEVLIGYSPESYAELT